MPAASATTPQAADSSAVKSASAAAPVSKPERAPKPRRASRRVTRRATPEAAKPRASAAAPAPLVEPDTDDLALDAPQELDLPPVEHEDRPVEEPGEKKRGSRRRERRDKRGKRRGRGERARHEISAARRAELVAAAAALAAAGPDSGPSSKAARPGRHRAIARLAVLVVVGLVAAATMALVIGREPVTPLSPADASFMIAQLVRADQRVRAQLELLAQRGPSLSIDRARDAMATTRSLMIETRGSSGAQADALRRALTLEAAWLDAVGSTLANPRSPLLTELVPRDASARSALGALRGRALNHNGGVQALVDYSQARVKGTPPPQP